LKSTRIVKGLIYFCNYSWSSSWGRLW